MQHQNNRLIRRPEVRDLTGLSSSALDRLVRSEQFPQPINIVPGGRAVAWSEQAVHRWINERIAASGRAA